MDASPWTIVLLLGLLLGAALMAGALAGWLRLPRVTIYLLVGVLLGPSGLGWVGHPQLELLEPLTKLAIALVLFGLGCEFALVRTRRILRRVLRLARGELVGTLVLVFVGLLLLGARWEVAMLLGVLALATAPATTILVLKETESEGPLTDLAHALVALNNLVSIVLFEVVFLGIEFVQGPGVDLWGEFGHLASDLAGSVALGMAGGLLTGLTFGLVAPNRRLVLLTSIVMLLLGISQISQMPYLLTFLAMGVTVANSSDQRRQITAELDRLTGLLCVVFFVAHGAAMEVGKLPQAGLVGLGYIAFRFAGKCLGIRWAAGRGREEPSVRRWLGPALVAQAGAAIALSAIAFQRTLPDGGLWHEYCAQVQTVILGTVVVFEILGPILIRQAVLRAGEMPLAQAIHPGATDLLEQLRILSDRLLMAAGYNPWRGRSPNELTVGELMRKNVPVVSQADTFAEVVEVIEHSRDNTYPVVGTEGELLGVIRYRELSSALFDPALGPVVRADDITTPAGWVLHPDETAARAYQVFQTCKDDCVPVVTRPQPHRLLGVVRRRDVLRMLARGHMDLSEPQPERPTQD